MKTMTYNIFHGEEEAILKYLPEDIENGIIIDVGAYHPTWRSNSYFFEKNGWKAICIEANPHCIDLLKAERQDVLEYAVAERNENNVDFFVSMAGHGPNGMAGFTALKLTPERYKDAVISQTIKVSVRKLDDILQFHYPEISKINILCIDTEMGELDVLKGCDLYYWRPEIVFAENLNEYGNDLNNLRDYMDNQGYQFMEYVAHQNDLYLRKDLVK